MRFAGMLRAPFAAPARLAFGSVPRSLAALCAAPTAAASARLTARPLAASFYRPVGSVSLRARSTIATAAVEDAVVAPKRAAELRALDVLGVVDFVTKELKIDADDCKKLAEQKIDGAALLETSVAELCDRYRLSGGAAHRIVRGIAPAVAEVQAAAALAAVEAQSATLTIFPPRPKNKGGNVTHETLTPAEFLRMFDVLKAPLRIATESGLVLGTAKTLVQAVEASRSGLRLLASRRYDDDYSSYDGLSVLNGFETNCSTALKFKSTRALAADSALIAEFGPLELVNSGEEVKLRLPRLGDEALELALDGLVVSTRVSVLLFTSAKHTPSEDYIYQLLLGAKRLERMLLDFADVSTTPPAAKEQLAKLLLAVFGASKSEPPPRGRLRIMPFLSGDNFSALVAAECEKMGVGVVRPSGEGFVVKTGAGGGGIIPRTWT